jgi:hypothetical protein
MEKNKQKTNKQSEGLGDTIAKITNLLMIDQLAQKLAEAMGEEDCGCTRRKEKLNEMFPYNKDKNKSE